MKPVLSLFYLVLTAILFSACKDERAEQENKWLLTEIVRLKKDSTLLSKRIDSIKIAYEQLEARYSGINSIKDSLENEVDKQAKFEALRRKAESMPFELPSVSLQNQDVNGKMLKAGSPFKKSEVRYLSFKGKAINNASKVGKNLKGQLYAVFRKGTMVQQMPASGTFKSSKGINQIFTNSWSINSSEEAVLIDKGIGDKSRGILASGDWTLELWFQPLGATQAYLLIKKEFEIL